MSDKKPVDADTLRKRLRRYAGLFFVLGVLQACIGVLTFYDQTDYASEQAIGLCLSGVFLATAAIMAWNGSRFASLAILVWIIVDLAYMVAADGILAPGIVQRIIYLLLALMMSVHSFRHWSVAHKSSEGRVRGWAWTRWAGLMVLLPIAALTAYGLTLPAQPVSESGGVLSGRDIPSHHLSWMREQDLLYANETPLLFYSAAGDVIAEDGNILTDRYLGSWWNDEDGELASDWIRLGTACEIKKTSEEAGILVYDISRAESEDILTLWLPDEDRLSATFIARLKYLNARHTNEELTAACAEDRPVDWKQVARLNGIPSGIVEGDDIDISLRQWLFGNNFLLPQETPLWLHSTAIYAYAETGTLMTETHFGGWEEEDGVLNSVWFKHGEICAVEPVEQEEAGSGTLYRAYGPGDETWVQFSMPDSDPTSDARVKELKALTAQYRTEAHAEACETGPDDEA